MKIETADGAPIRSMQDWSAIHKPTQWKRGRSAYSIADFILNRDGAPKLAARVSAALGERVAFREITPELEVRFDRYGKGRFHDLGIRGETESGKSLFVGVEAKVDESFGAYVADEWRRGQRTVARGQRTRLPNRILELCDRFQDGGGISQDAEIRYQLMHGAAGTVDAGADLSVLYIAVFKTDDYDESKAETNRQDYLRFIDQAGGAPNPNALPGAESHALNVGGKPLVAIYEYFDMRD